MSFVGVEKVYYLRFLSQKVICKPVLLVVISLNPHIGLAEIATPTAVPSNEASEDCSKCCNEDGRICRDQCSETYADCKDNLMDNFSTCRRLRRPMDQCRSERRADQILCNQDRVICTGVGEGNDGSGCAQFQVICKEMCNESDPDYCRIVDGKPTTPEIDIFSETPVPTPTARAGG